MPTFENLFEIMLHGSGPDGAVRNVFHYWPEEPVLNGNDAAEALAVEFAGASGLGFIKALISTAITFTQVRVTDLSDTDTLFDLSVSIPGTNAGNEDYPNVAVTYRSSQPAVGVHRASKRFGPVALGTISPDGIVPSSGAVLENIRDMLNGVIHTDNDGQFVSDWHLMLVKRILVSAGPPAVYRLPGPSDFPAVAYETFGWDWNRHAGTQNTRKFGRGE